MRIRSKLIQQCGLCARWTHDGEHIPSGNRNPGNGNYANGQLHLLGLRAQWTGSVHADGETSGELAGGASAAD